MLFDFPGSIRRPALGRSLDPAIRAWGHLDKRVLYIFVRDREPDDGSSPVLRNVVVGLSAGHDGLGETAGRAAGEIPADPRLQYERSSRGIHPFKIPYL